MRKLYLENLNSKKYNYFYKITNKINRKYYYGVHSTDNLNDGYMGSGVRLLAAFKKYGIKNFYKEIVDFFLKLLKKHLQKKQKLLHLI